MRINRFALYLIPLIGVAAIPQILFFWLAPDAPCYITTYIFGTFITLTQLTVSFIMWTKYGIRKSAAITLVGSGIALTLLITCGILLAAGASMRTAIYSLSVISVIYVIAITPLVLTALDAPAEDRQAPPDTDKNNRSYIPTQNQQHPAPAAERYTTGGTRGQTSGRVQPPPLPERR